MEWEAVIGLEVHVSLSTNTKLFSGTASIFGAEPNTQANIFDLAMPGTLQIKLSPFIGGEGTLTTFTILL